MKLTVNDVSLQLPAEEYPKHTKTFMSIMLTLVDKAKDNPAMQLHTLSLIATGKPFLELLSKDKDNMSTKHLITAIASLAETTIEMSSGGDINLSDFNIDDILGK